MPSQPSLQACSKMMSPSPSKNSFKKFLGRGSFTESFPLFGYNLSDYETLFEEKLDLFAAILKNDAVTWQGRTCTPPTSQRIFPPI